MSLACDCGFDRTRVREKGLFRLTWHFTEVASNTRPIDRWLASQPEPMSLIEYPLPAASKLAMYRQSLHRSTVVNGYMRPSEPTRLQQAAAHAWPVAHPAGVDLLRGLAGGLRAGQRNER